jgi:hypothetical protein
MVTLKYLLTRKQIGPVFDIKVDAIMETKCRHIYQTNTYSLLMWVSIETRYLKVFITLFTYEYNLKPISF